MHYKIDYKVTLEVWIDPEAVDGDPLAAAKEYAGGEMECFCHSFHRNREEWVDDASVWYEEILVRG